jgi:hypothetical protein
MIVLKNRLAEKPERYPKVERKLPTVDEKGWVKVGGFLLRDHVDYIPQPGFQEVLCSCEADVIFTGGSASAGKAQPYDAQIVTPFGLRNMGALKEGDTISGVDGGMQRVLRIHEQGEKDVYKFTFIDGATCEACLDHLWNVRKMRAVSKKAKLHGLSVDDDWRVWDTKSIIDYMNGDTKNTIAIPLSNPVKFTISAKQAIDPYILGLLIGDGCFVADGYIGYTSIDHEIIETIKKSGYNIRLTNDGRGMNYAIKDKDLIDSLTRMKLIGCKSEHKFIPWAYKYGTVEERIAIIQGLMDSDGYAEKEKSAVGFSSASEQLSKDVQEIIWSLGGIATLFTKKSGYKDKTGAFKRCLDAHVLYIQTQDNKQLFRLQRKIDVVMDRRFTKTRLIKSVELVGKKKCRCIHVTNPDSLYLTEKSCIVTHNTWAILTEAMRGLGTSPKDGYSAILLKKELVEAKAGGGMLADAKRLYADMTGCAYTSSDSPTFDFPMWKSSIQLTHLNLQSESQEREAQEKMKNKQASYIAMDELTNFSFKIWKYWFSRNRDDSGMRPKMICTLNANGWHWTRRMLDWYIGDDNFVIPERVGVIRYFVNEGETVEDIIWGNSPEEVARLAGIEITDRMKSEGIRIETLVKSFTFIPGNLMDNRILTNSTRGGNVANLYNIGKAERLKLMYGYWGETEEGEAMVTKSQIRDLFTNPWNGDTTIKLSIDIGDGGDASRCWVWKGNQVINIETNYSDDAPAKAAWVRHLQTKYKVELDNIAVDATGGGNYLDDYVRGVRGLVMNTRPIKEYDESGNEIQFEQYVMLRDQLMSKLCAMIASQGVSIAIDPETTFEHGKAGSKRSSLIDILQSQATCLKRLQKPNGKYFFASKMEWKKSHGESPDDLDCFHMGMVFFLDMRDRKKPEKRFTASDFKGLYTRW